MKQIIIVTVLLLSGCATESMKRADDQWKAHQVAHTKMLQEAREAEKARAVKRQGMIDRGEITGGSNEMPDYWLLFR